MLAAKGAGTGPARLQGHLPRRRGTVTGPQSILLWEKQRRAVRVPPGCGVVARRDDVVQFLWREKEFVTVLSMNCFSGKILLVPRHRWPCGRKCRAAGASERAEAGDVGAPLKPVQKPARQRDHDEVVGAHREKNLGEAECVRGHHLAFAHEFHAGDEIGEGTVLDEIDDLVAAAGERPARGLGHHDPEHGLPGGEAQGLGGQDLPPADGEQRATHIFRLIGGRAEDEGRERRAIGREIDAELGQGVVDHHQLDSQRHPAQKSGIAVAEAAQPARAEGAGTAQGHAARKAEARRRNDERQRDKKPLVEGGQKLVGEKNRIQHDGLRSCGQGVHGAAPARRQAGSGVWRKLLR